MLYVENTKHMSMPHLHLKNLFIIWITQHVRLLTFNMNVFTFFNVYFRLLIFTLFVSRVNLENCCCFAIHVTWNMFTMEISLDMFFSCFQLTMHVFNFSFYRLCCQLFRQLLLNLILVFRYWNTYFCAPETLSDIV